MKKLLIGFVGPKTSGKTLAAGYLKKIGFVDINFKDNLDIELQERFEGLLLLLSKRYKKTVYNLIYKKPLVPEIRELKKSYGTDVMRRIDQGYWVNGWERHYYALYDRYNICTDDVRFQNEARMIKKHKGILIRVNRKTKGGDQHLSETEQDFIKCDYTVDNNGTKEELRKNLQTVLALYATKKRCWTVAALLKLLTGLLLLALLVYGIFLF
jgi:hypothetical protein